MWRTFVASSESTPSTITLRAVSAPATSLGSLASASAGIAGAAGVAVGAGVFVVVVVDPAAGVAVAPATALAFATALPNEVCGWAVAAGGISTLAGFGRSTVNQAARNTTAPM